MSFTPRFPHFLHGGDYNPDQWLDRPDILERDVQLMQEAHVNAVSVGIFSWTLMEPEEGRYEFDWLDEIIDQLWRGGIHVVLATPSGARPVWMAKKYPEVLRVNDRTQRIDGENVVYRDLGVYDIEISGGHRKTQPFNIYVWLKSYPRIVERHLRLSHDHAMIKGILDDIVERYSNKKAEG